MENKNKCCKSSEKTMIVDPNKFDGHDSSNNISVPLEDLNISVELKTYKRGRTILTTDKSVGTSESKKEISINFIEGSEYGTQKVLTTKFTDLTTSFESGSEQENLGISNIDIEFNSSMAPMITINFIDVRGSAIFQNESNIKDPNSTNKYNVLFQLPYPIYELTIKGYYGRPVRYCLHMTKFNTKFNSQTGNFEITANFIGYTYAMLSDMLVGVLAAIPYVNYGTNLLGFDNTNGAGTDLINIYKDINTERAQYGKSEIITLTDLVRDITKINDAISKVSSTSENAEVVNISTTQETLIVDIEGLLKNLYVDDNGIDLNPNQNTAPFIIFKSIDKSVPKLSVTQILKNPLSKTYLNYKTSITAKINEFNKTKGVQFTDSETKSFTDLYKDKKETTISLINDTGTTVYDIIDDNNELKDYIKRYTNVGVDIPIGVLNLIELNNIIEAKKSAISNKKSTSTTSLANEVVGNMQINLGFSPTIRNIVEIFTTSVEAFMRTLYRVSKIAEESSDRYNVLSTYFTDDRNSDISGIKDKKQFYAWPDYNEKIEKVGYVEKYLGQATGLSTADKEKITELVFVDKLLEAFHIKAKIDTENNIELLNQQTNWIPVNPLDSPMFSTSSPYSRIEGNLWEEFISLMLNRAMTFLYFSSESLKEDDYKKMVDSEVNAIVNNCKNILVKKSLRNLSDEQIIGVNGVVNGSTNKVITGNKYTNLSYNGNYEYSSFNYEYTMEIIPIAPPNYKKWGSDITKLKEISNSVNFLSNYSNTTYENGSNDILPKKDDGSIYVKIFTTKEFKSKEKPLIDENIDTTNVILLEKIKVKELTDLAGAGFNIFGGTYGVQEFVNLDYGNDDLKDLPLMFMFYSGNDSESLNCLCTNKTVKSKWDLTEKKYIPPTTEMFNFKDKNLMLNYGKNRGFFNDYTNASFPFINKRYQNDNTPLSIFGSTLFYGQYDEADAARLNKHYYNYAQALLFLSSLPWNGDAFESPEIINLFKHASGFIHVPKLWCAYVGGLMWRADSSAPVYKGTQIIGGGSGTEDPILWRGPTVTNNPGPYLLYGVELDRNIKIHDLYQKDEINNILLSLPEQVKNEFKKIFFDFVNSEDKNNNRNWENIYNKLIISDRTSKFSTKLNALIAALPNDNSVNNDFIKTYFPLLNDGPYVVATPIIDEQSRISFIGLELGGDYTTTPAIQFIIDAMIEEVVIANNSFRIWNDSNEKILYNPLLYRNLYDEILVNKESLINYIKLVNLKLKEKIPEGLDEKKEVNQQIFATADENAIKLHLYRLCKNINDKWFGDITNEDEIFFQCGGITANKAMGEFLRGPNTQPRLIDTFRFLSRSFEDIGDVFFINPMPVKDFLLDNPNTSFYNVVTSLLSANNFDFIALPSFVNYKTQENVEEIFKTIQYDTALEDGICGPSFVSVYVGQSSKNLSNIGNDYPNDGLDLQCDSSGNILNLPEDFSNKPANHESLIAGFNVNFSQQNQNIFKDITLDQSEFTETAESLQIIDAIATTGSENSRTLAGQNLYNVYSVRSYKVGVEMMGNAMVQPMMYFQLNNIPMFHGAYMITQVKHSIKPNFMSTNFTGVRIRYSKTPLMTENEMYQSLLVSLGLLESVSASNNLKPINGNFPPIVGTIIDSDETAANGNIPNLLGKVDKVKFVSYAKNIYLIKEAIPPLEKMLNEWVTWLQDNGWFHVRDVVTLVGGMRDYNTQVRLKNENIAAGTPENAAEPGTSNHGWGIALDINYFDKNFKMLPNEVSANGFDTTVNPAIQWLYDNASRFGWVLPIFEPWHLEYYGTSANLFIEKYPTHQNLNKSKTYNMAQCVTYDATVTNPIDSKTGKPAIYTDITDVHREKTFDGVGTFVNGDGKVTASEVLQNQITVKNALKLYLGNNTRAKDIAAGIMGNITGESGFNHKISAMDSNGFYSIGLIQWNTKYTTGGFDEIGTTALQQINYVTKNAYWSNFMSDANTATIGEIDSFTYLFAKNIERCAVCVDGKANFATSATGNVRIASAKSFYTKFSTTGDALFW